MIRTVTNASIFAIWLLGQSCFIFGEFMHFIQMKFQNNERILCILQCGESKSCAKIKNTTFSLIAECICAHTHAYSVSLELIITDYKTWCKGHIVINNCINKHAWEFDANKTTHENQVFRLHYQNAARRWIWYDSTTPPWPMALKNALFLSFCSSSLSLFLFF